ncbi:Probable phosphatidylinositol phosphate kinase [Galdieria sulphuraria]|uniref:1-phosphatidylinositol-4-phosphate 5-kinase n=1 Tax=Galdieria sulphuraria TaxID=130081 RepID=M2W126_GALSU|nr:1-phosphatidylinositol-4-phosphate 5-kinase [Galdieria sulphuraria]EME29326.1 1-phosphatidylinositol-4-phosphate 5-kinase [Galdieria sulphuraria]GJD05856.1 Probable phosphatidylinositol phosphate kinase [Galdieria sulphuraria]|eukprot:XP_005705846.1 1-phosphatidylinositol-4-phosphate 5-kinase [Galdieria sulphuraria]
MEGFQEPQTERTYPISTITDISEDKEKTDVLRETGISMEKNSVTKKATLPLDKYFETESLQKDLKDFERTEAPHRNVQNETKRNINTTQEEQDEVAIDSGNDSDISSEGSVISTRKLRRRYRASSPLINSPREETFKYRTRRREPRQRGFTDSDRPLNNLNDALPPRLSHTFLPQDRLNDASSASLRDINRLRAKVKVGHYRRYQGEVIYKGHHSYDLMQQIKLGIQHSVVRISQVAERNLMMDDFIVEQKTTFSPFGGVDTPPHNTPKFTFKDYFPMVFRDLRQRFGINSELYLRSVCGSEALRELSTPGKSGSLFFHSWDDRFILKTVPKAETNTLKKILPQYYFHMMQNKESLITRFFGLYRITTHKINARRRHIRIVVMNNFLPTRVPIHEKYDLKGSTLGRQASPTELLSPYVTLKDLDFVRNGPLLIDKTLRERLLNQLGYDLLFLSSINIMDYSFLVGLHIPSRESRPPGQGWNVTPLSLSDDTRHEGELSFSSARIERPSFSERVGGWIGKNMKGEIVHIFFGIIDILDEYSLRKESEHFLKTRLLCAGSLSVSVCEPSIYAQRLKKFVKEAFLPKEEGSSTEQSPRALHGAASYSPLSSPKSPRRKTSTISRSAAAQEPYVISEEAEETMIE